MGLSQRMNINCKARDPFIWKLKHYLYRNDLRTKKFVSSASENGEVMEMAKDVRPFEKIPGPKSNRFLGTLPKYLPIFGEYRMDALHKNAMLNYHLYGRLVRERILPSVNLVHVFHPDDMEVVFRSEGRYPERRSHLALFHYRKNKPEVYNTGGLLSTNGAEWWRLRSGFQKNMTSPQSMKSYVTRIDAIAQEFVSWLQQTLVKRDDDDLLPYLNRLLLETIGVVAFNMRLNSFSIEEGDPTSRSSKIIMAAFESNSGILRLDHGFLWKYFNTPLYKKMARSQEYLEKFSKEVLTSKLNLFQASLEQTPQADTMSLLDMFLLLPGVDLKDIVGMMVDILMAAVDTTSYSTSFLLYHIARNPTSQERLFKECLELMPRADSPITNETLTKAVYAKSCIKESLRLNPVAIGVGRVLEKDVVLSGYHVPSGTVIVTQNMVASRLHQYCSDPAIFKPERWIRQSDDYENIHPFMSLPFGFGPRSCIARRLAEQTMCVNLLKIVRNFQLDWTGGDMDVKTLLINKPNCSVQIKMTPITVTEKCEMYN